MPWKCASCAQAKRGTRHRSVKHVGCQRLSRSVQGNAMKATGAPVYHTPGAPWTRRRGGALAACAAAHIASAAVSPDALYDSVRASTRFVVKVAHRALVDDGHLQAARAFKERGSSRRRSGAATVTRSALVREDPALQQHHRAASVRLRRAGSRARGGRVRQQVHLFTSASARTHTWLRQP